MSLINDALKRAKAAHQQSPAPPPDLPFRPVEPTQQRARRGLGLLPPVFLAVVAMLVLFVAWQWTQRNPEATPTEAAARTFSSAARTPTEALPQPATRDAAPTPAVPNTQSEAPTPASTPTPIPQTATEATNPPVADVQSPPASNAVPVAAPEPPKPEPLRLQAILFNPQRPSAMISGKTVFVGDKVRDLRVVAISPESATLANSAQTNVLNLSY